MGGGTDTPYLFYSRRIGLTNGLTPLPTVSREAVEPLVLMAAEGIRRVLCGEQEHFSLEYPCHSPDIQRWFMMRLWGHESALHRPPVPCVDQMELTSARCI